MAGRQRPTGRTGRERVIPMRRGYFLGKPTCRHGRQGSG